MKAFLRRVIPLSLRTSRVWRSTLGRPRPQRSWSPYGEDLILRRLVRDTPHGTYVDVGAFHPTEQSTTHALYKQGWSGINIDAQPGSMKRFRRARRRDINLEVGVGAEPGELDFFARGGKVSTFDPVMAAQWAEKFNSEPEVKRVEVTTLRAIFDTHRPERIDVLMVDAEGFDLAVLQGNDWDRYRPRFVVVEVLAWYTGQNPEVRAFMEDLDYFLVAATPNNLFFRRPGPAGP